MNKNFIFLLIITLFAIPAGGCAGTGIAAPAITSLPSPTVALVSTEQPESAADLTYTCFGDAHPAFNVYTKWTKVNPTPINGHESKVNIYVDDLAKDTYLSASGEAFPVCATIVKPHLSITANGSETVTAITVMVKMPAGYDPEHNDWWWGMYNAPGEIAEMSGKVQVCIDCHQPVAASDYVFSQAVSEQINK